MAISSFKAKVPRNRDTFWKTILHFRIAVLVFVVVLVIFFTCIAIFCKQQTLDQITTFFDRLSYPVRRILEVLFK